MVDVQLLLERNATLLTVVGILFAGVLLGYGLGWVVRRLLTTLGVPDAVEGTSFDRTMRSLGTSTVGLFSHLTAWFVYGVAILLALHVAGLLQTQRFWTRATGFLPDLFIATAVFGIGFVLGEKAELVVGERLRGIKLPEIGVLPKVVKYSVLYVAALIALNQVGVAAGALVVLLAAYAAALILITVVALRDVLASASAGIFVLLSQPYGIGDRVTIGDREGVVQEVTVLVTRIEDDGTEYVVPNHRVLRSGAAIHPS